MRAADGRPPAVAQEPLPDRQIALIDLLDRLLSGGVVLTGDVVLSIADIDLVRISLRALIVSISEQMPAPWSATAPPVRDGHDG
ncbi:MULTISPECIES: gas vesicle protein [Streptomyces]|uniref:Gas vesicle protein n=1 Tax=Streptomyces auratus AGR0001 TaxID=1160718 RepID=J2JSP3_9ACTN|nr:MULTISPECIES: gas vesicle protein [Streptomyces]QTZ90750.1 gas vesicle protein [Streptomyces auratus AGR0001]